MCPETSLHESASRDDRSDRELTSLHESASRDDRPSWLCNSISRDCVAASLWRSTVPA